MIRVRGMALVCLTILSQQAMYHYYPSPYRPTVFGGEPRLVQPWMTSGLFYLRGGYAKNGKNGCSCDCSTLNIYGCQQMHTIAQGVPQDILQCNPDCYFNEVWQKQAHCQTFGSMDIQGTLSLIEFLPTLIQNLSHGFFISLTVPIEDLTIKNINFVDLSTPKCAGPDISFARWQRTIARLNENIAHYGTCIQPWSNKGLGDIQLLAGWGLNYEDIEILDYIDFTITTGVNFPTGKLANPTATFSLPLGYNGHWAIPLIAYGSLGALDWLTIGMRAGALWFFDKTYCMPMKTATTQNGWVRLARGNARVNKGTIWHLEEYIKLDHIVENLSFIIGFGHDRANATCLRPCDTQTFAPEIVNSDELLKSWSMNRFHCVLEFDMATYQHPHRPRLSFTVDKAFSGKRMLKTSVFGTYIGVDLEWPL